MDFLPHQALTRFPGVQSPFLVLIPWYIRLEAIQSVGSKLRPAVFLKAHASKSGNNSIKRKAMVLVRSSNSTAHDGMKGVKNVFVAEWDRQRLKMGGCDSGSFSGLVR